MRIVVQEARDATVKSEGNEVGKIDKGEVLLVGFKPGDNKIVVDKMIEKLLKLRIFEDDKGMTNLSLAQKEGKILAVSQFTLYADVKHGNRPSFTSCMPAEEARNLFSYFEEALKKEYPESFFGVFQTYMEVSFTNIGPFTIILDSDELGYCGESDK